MFYKENIKHLRYMKCKVIKKHIATSVLKHLILF
jgi:hypothetical protein